VAPDLGGDAAHVSDDELRIEAMTEADLAEVEAIEQHSFREPSRIYAEELTRAWARIDVARWRGRVVGFSNYWLVKDEIQLLAIATEPDRRRAGVASALLSRLLEVAREGAFTTVTLEVRTSNLPAITLYQRFGFTEVAVRRQYYSDDGEDALIMSLTLGED
jgi:ribosomal-protein-alanine N-acetyltransferase